MERLLTADGATQMRPLSFFGDPNLREFSAGVFAGAGIPPAHPGSCLH